MKKVLSLVLAGLLTASMAVTAGAMAGNTNIGTVPYVTDAVAVDGTMDAAYAGAMVTEVSALLSGDSSATGTAYLIHNGENLYLYAEVADADMVECDPAQQESAPWNTDSFEIILDGTNAGTGTLYQARVDWSGYPSWYTNQGQSAYGEAAAAAIKNCAAVEIDGGYAVEAEINMAKMAVVPGSKIGIHYQVNDMHADGSAQTVTTSSGQGPWVGDQYLECTLAPVDGYIALDVFTQADVIDDDTTQDKGGNNTNISLMEQYGVGNSSLNDYVYFEDVDFGDLGTAYMTLHFGYGNDNGTTTALEVILDDPDAAPIAALDIAWTGGWDKAASGYVSEAVEIPAGIHTVYFRFANDKSGSLSEVYFTEAEPVVEEVVDGGSAPATFDAGVAAAVAAIISAAGYAVSKKR